MNSVTIETVDIQPQIGTSCLICDSFIPIISITDGSRICDECKKRLKKLLYESQNEE